MEIEAHRSRLYLWLRHCLIGRDADVLGADEVLQGIKPLERFQAGILFPIMKDGT